MVCFEWVRDSVGCALFTECLLLRRAILLSLSRSVADICKYSNPPYLHRFTICGSSWNVSPAKSGGLLYLKESSAGQDTSVHVTQVKFSFGPHFLGVKSASAVTLEQETKKLDATCIN